MKPGLHFLEVMHGPGCTCHLDIETCACAPRLRLHSDADYFLRSECRNRAERRKAARDAAKAVRRAARGGRA